MRLPEINYLKPQTVEEALNLLSTSKGNAVKFAGGTDVVVNLKRRLVNCGYLIDLKGIRDIEGITSRDDEIEVGALTKLSTIEASPVVVNSAPLLAKAASLVGGPQHRSMGTLGGNICLDTRCHFYNQSFGWRQSRPPCYKTGGDQCHEVKKSPVCHAIYSGDTAPALIALGARARVAESVGNREEPLENLYTHNGKKPIKLEEDSILISVIIPKGLPLTGFAYEKYRLREAIDFPVVGIVVSVTLDRPGGQCVDARIVLNAIGTAPIRALDAEKFLYGRRIVDTFDEAAEIVYRSARPIHSMGGSALYKKKIVKVLTRRALEAANNNLNG